MFKNKGIVENLICQTSDFKGITTTALGEIQEFPFTQCICMTSATLPTHTEMHIGPTSLRLFCTESK